MFWLYLLFFLLEFNQLEKLSPELVRFSRGRNCTVFQDDNFITLFNVADLMSDEDNCLFLSQLFYTVMEYILCDF